LKSLNTKAMEVVRKDIWQSFISKLPMCDPTLGFKFLKQIQVHYNMNPKPKMLTKKL
jgi:hypothetical protein